MKGRIQTRICLITLAVLLVLSSIIIYGLQDDWSPFEPTPKNDGAVAIDLPATTVPVSNAVPRLQAGDELQFSSAMLAYATQLANQAGYPRATAVAFSTYGPVVSRINCNSSSKKFSNTKRAAAYCKTINRYIVSPARLVGASQQQAAKEFVQAVSLKLHAHSRQNAYCIAGTLTRQMYGDSVELASAVTHLYLVESANYSEYSRGYSTKRC